jgi:hypothetical protein
MLDPSSLVVLARPGSPAVTCRIGCSTVVSSWTLTLIEKEDDTRH